MKHYSIYKELVFETFKLDSLNTRANYNEFSKLREVLLNLTQNITKSKESSEESQLFFRLLLITHYYAMRCSCVDNDQLDTISAKLSISLLRHTDLIAADKAFYEAGMMCQVEICL